MKQGLPEGGLQERLEELLGSKSPLSGELLRTKRKSNPRSNTIKVYAGYYRRFNADHLKTLTPGGMLDSWKAKR